MKVFNQIAKPEDFWSSMRTSPRMLLLGTAAGSIISLLLAALAAQLSPLTAFVGVIGLLVVGGMFLSPTFAVLALTFSLPFERIGRLTNDVDAVAISASRILGLVALASLLVCMALRKEKVRFGIAFYLYAGYCAVAWLSNIWANSPGDTYRESFRILGNLLFFLLLINAVHSYATARRIVMVWLLASMGAGAFSITDYYLATANPIGETEMGLTSQRRATVVSDGAEARSLGINVRRLFGTTAHPTLFGLNMTMTIPFLLWAWRSSRGWMRLLWSAGMLISFFAIVLSNTRAVFLLAIFTALFSFYRGLWKPNLQAALGFMVLVLCVIPFIPEDVYRRTLDPSLYTSGKGDAIRVRFKYWEKGWEIIQNNWMRGIGVGDQTMVVKMVSDETTGFLSTQGLRASAHNEYIWVFAEVGILGYAFFWGFIAVVTASSFRAASRLKNDPEAREEHLFMLAGQVLMVGVLLFAVQSEVFHYPLKAWWLIASLSCVMLRIARSRKIAAAGMEVCSKP